MKGHHDAQRKDADGDYGTCLAKPSVKVGTASSHESDLTEKKHRPRRKDGAM
jgi:hypothetical protein